MKASPPQNEGTREEFLTARQLAAVLQVSESTVRRLARAGRIPSVRLTPRLIRFHLPTVRAALDGEAQQRSRSSGARRANAESSATDSQLSFKDLF